MMMHACFAYTHRIAQVLKAHPVDPPTLHKILRHVQEPLSDVRRPNSFKPTMWSVDFQAPLAERRGRLRPLPDPERLIAPFPDATRKIQVSTAGGLQPRWREAGNDNVSSPLRSPRQV